MEPIWIGSGVQNEVERGRGREEEEEERESSGRMKEREEESKTADPEFVPGSTQTVAN